MQEWQNVTFKTTRAFVQLVPKRLKRGPTMQGHVYDDGRTGPDPPQKQKIK